MFLLGCYAGINNTQVRLTMKATIRHKGTTQANTYDVTLRPVRATIVAVEQQFSIALDILSVCP
jgi:hypothetical protein